MSNFSYLSTRPEYSLFANSAIEAEKVFSTSPAMCAVGCRKALELAVKWVYAADKTITMPYKDNLQSLLHEPSFRFAVDRNVWSVLPSIVKAGNLAVHTGHSVSAADAVFSLRGLFDFIQWVDYCYGTDYVERSFDETAIPGEKVTLDEKKILEQESLLSQKDAELEALRKQVESLSAAYTASKQQNQQSRSFTAADLTEAETRQKIIDIDLKAMGWKFTGPDADVRTEYEVDNMNGVLGQKGYADYVLMGKDGLPLAVIEAKRSTKDPNIGRKQAQLYADCLEQKFGRRPMLFTTNGYTTYFWDEQSGPQRAVSGVFCKDDLQKLMNRRTEKKPLDTIEIDDKITDRYYQKNAIRAVCAHIAQGFRRNLLVMATGTGKTRTASSLTDVLSRGGHVTNVLFLADRTALVKQAKDDFKKYLPDQSLCNLCSSKDDKAARIVFSTYPTMLNAIDNAKTKDGVPLFSPAHFDLIIVDESHRSIFKKYRAIFDYFDAVLVGLTATPKTDVDRNTYDFFEMEHGIPTYAYDYDTAVYTDHVLVPYYNYEVKTKFTEEGIHYDQLSPEDKARYEDDFAEDDTLPTFIPSEKLNKFIFNANTVDTVLQDLMERGIQTAGGDRFEEMRQELRELIKFLVDGVEGQKPVYTALADPVLEQTEGKTLDSGYDFGEYRERVNRYIMEHRSDTLAIHKLTQNIPLSQGDYTELEHIFTCELGSKEDYAREFRDTPFGLLVRKVAKLDHDAAMQAFSKFINDESLNAKQIAFVQKVIHYIEQNGYVESKAVLMKPPFDQPILFTRLFDGKTGSELMDTINSVKENATHVTA